MISRSHGTSSEPEHDNTNTFVHDLMMEETGDEFFQPNNNHRYHHRRDTKDHKELGWIFILANLLLEILVLAFDQMALPNQPRYGLIVWGLCSAVMFVCIAELIFKGMIKEKLSILQCLKSLLPFSSPGGKKPYGFVDALILLGAKVQMALASIGYAYLHQDINKEKGIITLRMIEKETETERMF
ncbi:hypothetical protein MANES_11G004300v8 [Manihot esculenta]|uniref:Uncharacterized protein n=1 Tax=Manihot esculenta TaxID=3983 RepID=A0ACB7GWN5_MANES|nr:hypothetical protein MANES_11G004300v8 [Manihot esculenta]